MGSGGAVFLELLLILKDKTQYKTQYKSYFAAAEAEAACPPHLPAAGPPVSQSVRLKEALSTFLMESWALLCFRRGTEGYEHFLELFDVTQNLLMRTPL